MIRRLIRYAVAVFCLLSLLAALGVSWLWWECRRGRRYVADASIFGTYVMVGSLPGKRMGVMIIRDWPGRPSLRLWTQRGYYEEHGWYWSNDWTRPTSLGFGLSGKGGSVAVFVRRDTGEPLRFYKGQMPDESLVRPSPPMPFWSVGNVPHAAVIAAALVSPLLWAGIRWRRIREHRHRVRLGLCLACGYDLRHSPEKCPECGAATAPSR